MITYEVIVAGIVVAVIFYLITAFAEPTVERDEYDDDWISKM